MSRVEHQLREYFDAGVERVTVEDAIAQAAVRSGDLEPVQPKTLRPAWAAAAAFGLTLVTFISVFVVLALLPGGARDAASGGIGPATPPAGVGMWPIAAMTAGGAAALTTWVMRRPRRHKEQRKDGKVSVMETMERIEVEEPTTDQLASRNRWLTIAVAVLVIAVLALGAWLAFGSRSLSPNAAPSEVSELMDDYTAAWNAHDVDAIAELVAPEYRIHTYAGTLDHDLESLRSFLIPFLAENNWHNTYDGPWYAVGGDGIWTVSGEGSTITGSMYRDDEGVTSSLFRVERRGGNLVVVDHYFDGTS